MVIAVDFAYARPATLTEAVELAARPGARVLAGGTDLVGWMRDDLVAPDLVVDLKGIPELRAITVAGSGLTIGALATFTDVLESDAVADVCPVLQEMALLVASPGIRNRATLVGNLCSAVPCCDAGPVLLAFEATAAVLGPDSERTLPVADLFRGPRETDLRPGEIVTGVTLDLDLPGRHGGAFAKLARYGGEDLAQASVAVVVWPGHDYRVAFGAVAPTPVRAPRIEELLRGHPLDDGRIEAAKALVAEETAPITDVRATAEYRLRMCEVMLDRALRAAATRLQGHGPPYGATLM